MPGGYGLSSIVIGKVTDDSGLPVSGAKVQFNGTGTPYPAPYTHTISDGTWLTMALAGAYNMTYSHNDYEDLVVTGVTILEAVINDQGTKEMEGDMILKSAFSVKPGVVQNNVTADQWSTVAFSSVNYDLNGDFASNVFTAPESGIYHFDLSLWLMTMDANASYYHVQIITTKGQFNSCVYIPPSTGHNMPIAFSCDAEMDVDDTAYVRILQSGGTAQTDIYTLSHFNGRFMGTLS